MTKKKDIIKRETPELWQWADTTINKVICHVSVIDEFIQIEKQMIEKSGRELLDVHVYQWYAGDYVNIDYLTRPKQNGNG